MYKNTVLINKICYLRSFIQILLKTLGKNLEISNGSNFSTKNYI